MKEAIGPRAFRRGATLAAALLFLPALFAGPAAAETTSSLGPLELFEGTGQSIVAPSLYSFGQVVAGAGGAGFGSGGGGAARTHVSEIKITKPIDQASPRLAQATASGKHFKKATIELFRNGSPLDVCLEDAFLASDRVATSAADSPPTEEVGIAYAQEKLLYGGSCSSAAGQVPSAFVVLSGLGPGGATIGARVDCLAKRCRGTVAVVLPGGGSSSAGKFSMGDGSVRNLTLAVPNSSRSFLRGHPGATLKTILTLAGKGSPLVGRDPLTPAAKPIAGLPDLSVPTSPTTPPTGGSTPTPTPNPTPTPLSQALQLEGCQTPVVGTPTVIAVTGSLAPARSGVSVSLEYVPASGPAPFPPPVVDVVSTDAAGHFGDQFDRRREGRDYSWSVSATVAEGGGYLAARSPSCAVPIP